jgi:SAM-dependent methyltransferase
VTSLLDFYQQHGISPVRQDITDLPAHFARRAALYRSLGLPPMAVKGKTVLEVGPGGGENALYTLSLSPQVYIALEPNAAAREALRALAGPVLVDPRAVEDVAPFPGQLFDLVLCEGLLGLSGADSPALLEACARHVAIGGVLVITCIDAISDHAEVLRRACAQRILATEGLRTAALADQVARLHPVFAPHLATLSGMTRSVDDWILDNLLNPASIGPTFSMPEALAQLDGRFEVLGSSPRFLTDWRWYKRSSPGNPWAIEAYWTQCHHLYDYRDGRSVHHDYRGDWCARPREDNEWLMARCQRLRDDLRAYEVSGLPLPAQFEDERSPLDHDPLSADPGWFGRGQQYLSVVRTA